MSVAALLLFAAHAHAQILGTTFSGPTTSDGASAYLNPAAMAADDGSRIELDLGLDVIELDYAPPALDRSSTTVVAPIGTLGAVSDVLGDELRLGLTIAVPYRTGGSWDREGGAARITRYYLVDASIFHVTATPAFSWSPIEWLTIGAGIDVVHARLSIELDKDLGSELNRDAGSTVPDSPFPYAHPDLAARTELSTSGWGVGAVGGVLIEPNEYLSIGAAIHAPISVATSGSADVTYPETLDEYVAAFLPSAELPPLHASVDVDLDLPLLVLAGMSVRPHRGWEIAFDYTFEHRSTRPSLDFVIVEATSPSITDTENIQGNRDRHAFGLRAVYEPIDGLRVALAGGFETGTIPLELVTPNNLDFDKWTMAVAASWQITSAWSILAEYQHFFLVPLEVRESFHRPIAQASLAAFNHPSPTGHYDGAANRFQIGATVALDPDSDQASGR
jgi:long-subunit fatty acid transport protein